MNNVAKIKSFFNILNSNYFYKNEYKNNMANVFTFEYILLHI